MIVSPSLLSFILQVAKRVWGSSSPGAKLSSSFPTYLVFLSAYTKKKMEDCPKVHWTSSSSFSRTLSSSPPFSQWSYKKADTRAPTFKYWTCLPEFAFFLSVALVHYWWAVFAPDHRRLWLWIYYQQLSISLMADLKKKPWKEKVNTKGYWLWGCGKTDAAQRIINESCRLFQGIKD